MPDLRLATQTGAVASKDVPVASLSFLDSMEGLG
jgi:hypothetical protein